MKFYLTKDQVLSSFMNHLASLAFYQRGVLKISGYWVMQPSFFTKLGWPTFGIVPFQFYIYLCTLVLLYLFCPFIRTIIPCLIVNRDIFSLPRIVTSSLCPSFSLSLQFLLIFPKSSFHEIFSTWTIWALLSQSSSCLQRKHGLLCPVELSGLVGRLLQPACPVEIPVGLTVNDSRIRHLNLAHNKLWGSILPQGSSTKNLNDLILEDNLFTGGISPELSSSPRLIILNLRRNHLSGMIPGELFTLPQLAVVLSQQGMAPEELPERSRMRSPSMRQKFAGAT